MKKGNIKENMLSLKSMKAELDLLKGKSDPRVSSVTEKIDSNGNREIITRLRHGGMFPLMLLSTILTYAHNIPIISNIIKYFSDLYGRSLLWRILVRLRKLFIVLNAAIGIYMLFKVTGFSQDKIIAGVSGMGYAYIELIRSLLKSF